MKVSILFCRQNKGAASFHIKYTEEARLGQAGPGWARLGQARPGWARLGQARPG